MTNLWHDKLCDLEFRIDRVNHSGLELQVPSGWRRRTTLLELQAREHTGRGEDVNYSGEEQLAFQAQPPLELQGNWTLGSYAQRLDELDLFPDGPPEQEAYRDYRRWAYESAALDLALKRHGVSLAQLLGRPARDVQFVASLSLGTPPSLEGLHQRRELSPGLRFKVDANPDWDEDFCARLSELDLVDVVDLKGFYEGTIVDQQPEPDLYARVVRHFPKAWIEDARWTESTAPVLEPHIERLTLDAPIHSIADLDRWPFAPRCLNCKPSRFGTLQRLFEFYATCEQRNIALYAGGQFELGVGRGQNLRLASIFHPEGSNDIAPLPYHSDPLPAGAPRTPLAASGAEAALHFAGW